MNAVEINLYRHGHTARNDYSDIVFGQSLGEPLDALGEAQAADLGAYQRDLDLIPELVFSSHAERAFNTANIALGVLAVSGQLPRGFGVAIDKRLVEQSLGTHEGMRRIDAYTPQVKAQIERERADYTHPGGESMRDLSNRGYAAVLDGARRATASGVRQVDNYTHNMTIAAILARIEGAVSSDEMHDYIRGLLLAKRIGNVSRTLVVWEREKFRIELIGEPTIL